MVSQLRLFLQVSETMSVTGEVSVSPGQAGQGLGDTSQSLLATHSSTLLYTVSGISNFYLALQL